MLSKSTIAGILLPFALRSALALPQELAITRLPPTPTVKGGCPTVTSERNICSTCIRPACLLLSTISQVCGCKTPVPTVYNDFPCSKGKCPGGCGTSYTFAKPTTKCPNPTIRPPPPPPPPATTKPPTMPESCTFRPIETKYHSKGCAVNCNPQVVCIADAAVVQPCGCTSVDIRPTQTTICATKSPCPLVCETGWGFFTITETGCTGPTANPLPYETM